MEACAILNEESVDSVAHLLQVGISGCSMLSQDGEGSYSIHNISTKPVTAPCLSSYPLYVKTYQLQLHGSRVIMGRAVSHAGRTIRYLVDHGLCSLFLAAN